MLRRNAYEIFTAGVNSVLPEVLLPKNMYYKDGYLFLADWKYRVNEINNLIVIAAGKAASDMSKITEERIGNFISKGLCITKYNHAVTLKIFKTIEAGHPLPDNNSILAGKEVLDALQNLTPGDIVLLLLSGGASSLLADTPPGITLENLYHLSRLLINSGADIYEVNTIRKHLSQIKGGNFIKAAYPASVVTMIISDVVGDDPATIASGPTSPDSTTFEAAKNVLLKYGIWNLIHESIREHIHKGVCKEIEETPKAGSFLFEKNHNKIIGSNKICLEAAKLKAEQLGFHTIILTDKMTGDTDTLSRKFILNLIEYEGIKPACILLGGETSLQVSGNGKGGRNQHFVLCAMNELLKMKKNKIRNHITILSAGTDGTDGSTDAAGAMFSSLELYSGPVDFEITNTFLASFDSYNFFLQQGGLIKTGPTQTNVMDIVIGIIH